MSWAKLGDWESKAPLAVPLKVTRAEATLLGAFLQKGTKKKKVLFSAASLPMMPPL